MNASERSAAHQDASVRRTHAVFFYAMGLLTAGAITALIAAFVVHRVGLRTLEWKLFRIKSEPSYGDVMVLPKNILQELIEHKAVIENAGNPTVQARHNTVLTKPDPNFEFVLRPNVEVEVHTLRSTQPHNWEPPVLVFDRKVRPNLSPALEAYLREQSLLSCVYSIDDRGFRKTVPAIRSTKKILVVGDSVAFGIGVDDHQTIASLLQQRFGKDAQVINAAVGGYSGRQALQVAEKLSAEQDFSCLIYVACQNDLLGSGHDWKDEADWLLRKARDLAPRFDGHVIIFFQTYMQYTLYHILLDDGWERKAIDKTDAVRQLLALRCAEFGFGYVDWKAITDGYERETGSPFGAFALYVDHCHFSVLGNALAAEALWRELEKSKRLTWLSE